MIGPPTADLPRLCRGFFTPKEAIIHSALPPRALLEADQAYRMNAHYIFNTKTD
jgi:hypothetical protein